jgi:hypothetical protein
MKLFLLGMIMGVYGFSYLIAGIWLYKNCYKKLFVDEEK